MAVYHFTFHAYRSWPCDHGDGFTLRGRGHQPPDPDRASSYDGLAHFPTVTFDEPIQNFLIVCCHDICARRGWLLYMVGTDPSHLHVVVGWHGRIDHERVRARLKNVLSFLMGKLHGQTGRPWFVENAGRRRVKDREHFDHLRKTYLPGHRGVFWERSMPLPWLAKDVRDRCFPGQSGGPGLPLPAT